jgi:hypothetical protein
LEERHRREDHVRGAICLRRLEAIHELAVRALREPGLGERASESIPAEALEGDALVGARRRCQRGG